MVVLGHRRIRAVGNTVLAQVSRPEPVRHDLQFAAAWRHGGVPPLGDGYTLPRRRRRRRCRIEAEETGLASSFVLQLHRVLVLPADSKADGQASDRRRAVPFALLTSR